MVSGCMGESFSGTSLSSNPNDAKQFTGQIGCFGCYPLRIVRHKPLYKKQGASGGSFGDPSAGLVSEDMEFS